MTAILFNLSAAQDALARSDDGDKALPGDADLIAALEGFCQQEQARYEDAVCAAERAVWLASQCGGCELGGSGEACDEHHDTEEDGNV